MNPLPLHASRSDRELESYCRSEGVDLWSLFHPARPRRPRPAPVTLPGPLPCEEGDGRCGESA